MNIIFDSWDYPLSLDSNKWTSVDSGCARETTTVRTGSASVRMSSGSFFYKAVDNKQTIFAGWAAYHVASTGHVFKMTDGSQNQLSVKVTDTGRVQAYRWDNNVFLGESAIEVIPVSTWYYMEVKGKIHSSTGEVVVKVNGVEVLNLTGQNTQVSSNAYCTKVYFYSDSMNMYRDDVYLNDDSGSAPHNTFWGDTKVECIRPSASGSSTQWTANGAASNWDCVDEIPWDSDTTYVSSSTVGQRDLYTLEDISASTGTIYGMQVNIVARKDDAGSRSIAPVIRTNSTNYVGTTVTVGNAYTQVVNQIWNANPNTSNPWTVTDINNLEAGFDLIS